MAEPRPSWIELSSSALEQNIGILRHFTGSAKLLPCIKANSYGHGLPEIAAALQKNKLRWISVHSSKEAAVARRAGFTGTILVLGPVTVDDLPTLLEVGARFFLNSIEQAEALYNALPANTPPIRVHIKIDSGLHRLGFQLTELPALLDWLAAHPLFTLEAVATHFATADQKPDRTLFDEQVARFNQARAVIAQQYPAIWFHAANSSTTFLERDMHLGGVRSGLALYGYLPDPQIPWSHTVRPQPVLQWRTTIGSLGYVPAGETVGYGATWHATRPSRIAVLPVGYYDGYDRRFSNNGVVLIQGKRAPIIGRVCMNMCMVDVTDIPECVLGDTVTLIGTDGAASIWADELAEMINTIPYELLTRIHPEIPRTWVA